MRDLKNNIPGGPACCLVELKLGVVEAIWTDGLQALEGRPEKIESGQCAGQVAGNKHHCHHHDETNRLLHPTLPGQSCLCLRLQMILKEQNKMMPRGRKRTQLEHDIMPAIG